MGFKRWSATTGKILIAEGDLKEEQLVHHYKIAITTYHYNVLHSIVVNLDQALSKFVKSVHNAMVQKCIANVEIVGSGNKRLITATFVVTSDGRHLSMQLIYDGKTTRSMPFVDFPSFLSLSANPKHFSNTDGSVKVIKKTLVSYFESQKKRIMIGWKISSYINSRCLVRANDPRRHIVVGEEKHSVCEDPIQHKTLIAATQYFD